jgi:hypothetical protein
MAAHPKACNCFAKPRWRRSASTKRAALPSLQWAENVVLMLGGEPIRLLLNAKGPVIARHCVPAFLSVVRESSPSFAVTNQRAEPFELKILSHNGKAGAHLSVRLLALAVVTADSPSLRLCHLLSPISCGQQLLFGRAEIRIPTTPWARAAAVAAQFVP